MESVYQDRISHLPQPIRYKILSFIPMEDAIRTSILSRKWRYVTASLPNLEHDQYMFRLRDYDANRFRDIFDSLLIRRGRVDVERFALSLKGTDDDGLAPFHINSWILFAMRNNVRKFNLALWSDGIIIKLPCCFFEQCYTLTDLNLRGKCLKLKVPSGAVLPRLKRCTFALITFYDDIFTRKLFCICPSIEELTFDECSIMMYEDRFIISSATLKKLKLCISYSSTEFNINAADLQKIEYRGGFQLPKLSSKTLCSLVIANFASVKLSNNHSGGSLILFGLRNVIKLSLCDSYIESLSRHPNSLEYFATRSSLRHLELEIFPTWRHVNVVFKLLKSYKDVATLSILFQNNSTSTNVPDDQRINPDRFTLKNLNTVEFKDFGGGREELQIIRYILENANVLEKMKIKYLDALKKNITIRMVVSEELVNVTKASSCVTIFFE